MWRVSLIIDWTNYVYEIFENNESDNALKNELEGLEIESGILIIWFNYNSLSNSFNYFCIFDIYENELFYF